MVERNYEFLTTQELESFGYDELAFYYSDEFDDYDRNIYSHDYGKDTISDIVYDYDQDRALVIKLVSFDKFAHELTVDDDPIRSSNGLLKVKCKFCGRHFVPKKVDVIQRINYLNNTKYGQRHFYCSDECKENCPLIRAYKRDPQYSSQAREIVLELADYKCEICGSEDGLEVHHIKPFKTNKIEAYDIDNLVCLCKECHNEVGHSDRECTKQYLAKCNAKE